MRLKLLFVLLVGLFFVAQGHAVQKPTIAKTVKAPKILRLDSTKVALRQIDRQAVETYSKQKEFVYDDVAPKSLSWWDRFWRWVWDIIKRIFQGDTSGSPFLKYLFIFLKYLLIALAIGIVTFVVIKLLGLDLRLLSRKSKAIEVPYEESLENIHEIDFDDQLEKTIADGNYRLAVRLLYLKTLKHLSDREIINWQPDKTNQTYVHEVHNEKYRREFAQLTHRFEYIWYGEFFIDKNGFEPIAQSFQQFNQHTR